MSSFEIDQKVISLYDTPQRKVGQVCTVLDKDFFGRIYVKEYASSYPFASGSFMALEPTTPFGELSKEEKKQLVNLFLDGVPFQHKTNGLARFTDVLSGESVVFNKDTIYRVKPNNDSALDKLSNVEGLIKKLQKEAKDLRESLF